MGGNAGRQQITHGTVGWPNPSPTAGAQADSTRTSPTPPPPPRSAAHLNASSSICKSALPPTLCASARAWDSCALRRVQTAPTRCTFPNCRAHPIRSNNPLPPRILASPTPPFPRTRQPSQFLAFQSSRLCGARAARARAGATSDAFNCVHPRPTGSALAPLPPPFPLLLPLSFSHNPVQP